MTTVSNGDPTRKDTNMKLLFILSAILALTLAEQEKTQVQEIADSEAQASSVEILKEGADLKSAASTYPGQIWQNVQNTWQPPKPQQVIQAGNNWIQPPNNVQSDYYWSTGNPSNYQPTTTTTPVPVIKQEQYIGDRGDYKFEYQIGDGTHVGEQGYYTDPKQTDESLVKKGWYSFVGGDGRTYTVTWWADHTGYHAFGDHLPTPPPVPAAIQAAIDQQNQLDQFKPMHDYPSSTPAPQPVKPTYPTYVPNPGTGQYQPTYNPSQVPSYQPSQPTYRPPTVPSYNPNPPQYPQNNYYPQYPQNNYLSNYNV